MSYSYLKEKFHKIRQSTNPLTKIVINTKDFLWKAKGVKKFLIKIHNDRKMQEPSDGESKYNLGSQLWGYLSFQNFLDQKSHKIKIAENIKNIKIDIGLSFCAPNSAIWLEKLPDRIVFGFEPNRENVEEILTGYKKRPGTYHYLDSKFINERFFLFDVAIDSDPPGIKTFYLTENDPGTSSLYEPNSFKIKSIEKVFAIRLSDFLDLIPWNRFEYIEHIKVDSQGNDLRVLKSAGHYLSEKVVFVTAECSTKDQYKYSQTGEEMDDFMAKKGFQFIQGTSLGNNKTYVNKKFIELQNVLDYSSEGF